MPAIRYWCEGCGNTFEDRSHWASWFDAYLCRTCWEVTGAPAQLSAGGDDGSQETMGGARNEPQNMVSQADGI